MTATSVIGHRCPFEVGVYARNEDKTINRHQIQRRIYIIRVNFNEILRCLHSMTWNGRWLDLVKLLKYRTSPIVKSQPSSIPIEMVAIARYIYSRGPVIKDSDI